MFIVSLDTKRKQIYCSNKKISKKKKNGGNLFSSHQKDGFSVVMTILLNALLNFQYCIYKDQANDKALSITIAEILKKFQYLLKSAFITSFSESSLLFVGIMKWFMKESYFLVIRIQKIFYILTVTKVMEIFTTAKILEVKQALSPTANKKIFKFSIAICINCIGKMLI